MSGQISKDFGIKLLAVVIYSVKFLYRIVVKMLVIS